MISLKELTPDSLCKNLNETLATLSDDAVWREIPLISNSSNFNGLCEHQLVRFRGLVQDIRDPEIYLETFQTRCGPDGEVTVRNGKYRDNHKLEVISFVCCHSVFIYQNFLQIFHSGKRRNIVRCRRQFA